jgi:cephalosporin hydroxylase
MPGWSRLPNRLLHQLRHTRREASRRLTLSEDEEADIVDRFHRLYYEVAPHLTWQNTFWMGHRVLKCPLDLWVYQEILHEVRPDLIIETGTAFGGSALYLAQVCDGVGLGRVITVDVVASVDRPSHPRITYLTGSSIDAAILAQLTDAARRAERVMVILDSDHRRDHVLSELQLLGPLVTEGSYLIVEDTNVNGHPADSAHGPGPMEALDEFLAIPTDFVVDPEREKFLLSFNPRGFLRRTATRR